MLYHIDKILYSLVLLYGFDYIIARKTKHRWFSIHAFGNLIVVITTIPGVIKTLQDPINAMNSITSPITNNIFCPASIIPISMINAVHIYHMLFFNLNNTDLFHHILFIPFMGIPGQIYKWGALRSFLSFTVSGFPGGIDYFNLVLVKHNIIQKITQKKICSFLNLWVRAPLLCFEVYMHYMAWLYKTTTVPIFINILVGGLSVFNGLYYLNSSIRSEVNYIHSIKNDYKTT